MAVTKETLETWAKSRGWSQDRWGHFRKGSYRIKLSRVAARHERKGGTVCGLGCGSPCRG